MEAPLGLPNDEGAPLHAEEYGSLIKKFITELIGANGAPLEPIPAPINCCYGGDPPLKLRLKLELKPPLLS